MQAVLVFMIYVTVGRKDNAFERMCLNMEVLEEAKKMHTP
jgi:hypothetical protein